jgi:peptidoglycan/xylan/chitin deacetylase (PgdA/CDA1 family)
MLRDIKLRLLQGTHAAGIHRAVANSKWRRQRLLILCYHGVSQGDEHDWNPELFMSPRTFAGRMEILRAGGYNVLPLGEAYERLQRGTLPSRSVVLTFDDGATNFRTVALPILQRFGYPSTVYLRTDYCAIPRPVYPPVGPYLLWKRRDRVAAPSQELGWTEEQDLRTVEGRKRAWASILQQVDEHENTPTERDAILEKMAGHIGLDYPAFVKTRILQIMDRQDVAAIADAGVDVQLHTHHHRLIPSLGLGEKLRFEIEENQRQILAMTGKRAVHFCYPSGKFSTESLPALRDLGIVTATTCEPAMAARESDPLLLPRYVDTEVKSPVDFEAWLSGVGSLLPQRHGTRMPTHY